MRFKKYFMFLIYFGKERKRTTKRFLKLDFSLLLFLQLKVAPHLDSMWFLPYQLFVQLPCPWQLVLSRTLPLPGQFRSSDRLCFWCSLHRELSSTDRIFRYPNNLSLTDRQMDRQTDRQRDRQALWHTELLLQKRTTAYYAYETQCKHTDWPPKRQTDIQIDWHCHL